MSPEGAEFLRQSFTLSPLIVEHVYHMCYHFEAFFEAGVVPEQDSRPTCPKCQKQMSTNWDYEPSTIAESMEGAWKALATSCLERGLSFTVTYESPTVTRAHLWNTRTKADVKPYQIQGEHACLVLAALAVWDFLPEEERKLYLAPVEPQRTPKFGRDL